MPSDAPSPANSDETATVPGAVSRTLTSRSLPPHSPPVPNAAAKLAATITHEEAPPEDTLADQPERAPAPGVPVWIWAAVGGIVALGLGALLLI